MRSEFGEFLQWQPLIDEQVCQPEKLLEQLQAQSLPNKPLAVGTGWEAYPLLSESGVAELSAITLPSARYMLSLAIPMWYQKQLISAVDIEPVYLRNEVTWKKLPGRE